MRFTDFNIISIIIFLTIIGVIVYLGYKKYLIQSNFNEKYKLLSSNKNFILKYILLALAIFSISLSIFGIHYGEKKTKTTSKGIDIMFVLDVSKSMNVADIHDNYYKYKRLDLVKNSITQFVSKHKDDRVGLTIFAGDAIGTVPLTLDHNVFLSILKGVDYRNLTKQGSDFNKALLLGTNSLKIGDDRSKALIFISDGGDSEDSIDRGFLSKLKAENKDINYFVVGVGTKKGGKIIVGTNTFGDIMYQKYKGNYVISKINKRNLKNIAELLEAKYLEIQDINDLKKLDIFLNGLTKKVLEKATLGELKDISRNLAILGLILFLSFLIIYIKE